MGKEIIIRKSKVTKVIGYQFPILGFIGGIVLCFEQKYLPGFILIVLSPILYYWHHEEFSEEQQILLKITDNELWTLQGGYMSWESIICVKFRYEGRAPTIFIDIYRSNEVVADEEMRLENINYPVWLLKKILRRYTKVENH